MIFNLFLFIIPEGGGLTAPVVKWLKIKSNVDHAEYVREVRVYVHMHACLYY